jgi:hypothetical protein
MMTKTRLRRIQETVGAKFKRLEQMEQLERAKQDK